MDVILKYNELCAEDGFNLGGSSETSVYCMYLHFCFVVP